MGWASALLMGLSLQASPSAPVASTGPAVATSLCTKKQVDACGCHHVFGARHCHATRKSAHCEAQATAPASAPQPLASL